MQFLLYNKQLRTNRFYLNIMNGVSNAILDMNLGEIFYLLL